MPRDEETEAVYRTIDLAIATLDLARQEMDKLSSQRGVPIKQSVARINKALEYARSARDYWDHDVLRDNGQTTKAERQRAEAYELS